jgi:biopolymer transport protein ExbD
MKVHLGSHKKKRLITEINMVPFIDVVLVLLIIFMILSPFIAQSQIPVNLPRAAGQPGDDDTPLKLKITRDGDYYVGDQRVLRNNLAEKLAQAVALKSQRAVLIEADRDVSFKNVVLGPGRGAETQGRQGRGGGPSHRGHPRPTPEKITRQVVT